MNRIARSLALLTVCLATTPLAAQGGRAAGLGPPGQSMVRQRIVQILMTQARKTLALTEDQAPRLQRVVGDWAQKQLMLEQDEHQMRQALDEQMRPGVAAVADSLPKLVYGISANRVRQAQSLDDETHALGAFLTPVQLGQFQLIQERLLKNIRDLPKGRQPQP
jgi:hypothetical protein